MGPQHSLLTVYPWAVKELYNTLQSVNARSQLTTTNCDHKFTHMNKRMPPDEREHKLTGGFLYDSGPPGSGPQIIVRAEKMRVIESPAVLEKGAGKGRKSSLATMGMNPTTLMRGDPSYAACVRAANKFRKARMRELAQLHGFVSAGVGALLASSALALAASRYLYNQAAEESSKDVPVDAGLLKEASVLADKARQSDLAAWEVCAREGILRRRQEATSGAMPWLVQDTGNRGGRPKKVDAVARLDEVAPLDEVHVDQGAPPAVGVVVSDQAPSAGAARGDTDA